MSLENSRLIDRATATLVVGWSLWIFSAPLRAGGDLLAYAQDDFYYYLTAATNLSHGHGSTFDGTTLTNGYHPLYFLLLWAASAVSKNLQSIFRFLWIVDTASAVAIFVLVRTLFRRRLAGALLSNGLAAMIFYLSVLMISEQMEVTLTLPLGFLFLLLLDSVDRSSAHFATIGLTGAFLTLSRLDSVILVGLALAVLAAHSEERRKIGHKAALAFMVAFLPLLIAYFAVNLHFFHSLMPVSGAAKQLRQTHGVHLVQTFRHAAGKTRIMFALSLAALCILPTCWQQMRPVERACAAAAALFPFLHWGTILVLSDWPLWGWYSYSLRFSLAVCFLLVGVAVERFSGESRRYFAVAVYGVGLLTILASRYRLDPEMMQIAMAANQVKAFAATHPGRYAMGDRAGMVGYVSSQPTMQLEGLMEDRAFLHHIQKREALRRVLASYDVRYYVGFTRGRLPPCFEAVEPANAGPDSPVMRGQFCEVPAAVFVGNGNTVIYDLKMPTH